MGLFITFEGVEGCGKSTQARALRKRLTQLGITVELIREPGGTALGNEIRSVLKRNRSHSVLPETELLLFIACRYQLVAQIIRPFLDEGSIVICDRFADSTTVYQGYGRGMDLATIKAFNKLATQGTQPVLTILLDIPVEKGLDRKRVEAMDRFEREDVTFHNRLREGYLKLAAEEPERWLVVDATLSKAEIGKIIWDRVIQLISQRQDVLRRA